MSPPVAWTLDEKAVLEVFAREHPVIAKKIIGRNNELAAAVEAYNKEARATNRQILSAVGYTEKEIEAMEP